MIKIFKEEKAYKICIFGDTGVGKTTLTQRYLTNIFHLNIKNTMGAQLFVKFVEVKNIRITLQIWDFGGEDMFRFLLPAYSYGSSGGIFMFDLTNNSTLEKIEDWLATFKEGLTKDESEIPIIMVGGKLDLQDKRTISTKYAIKFLKLHNLDSYIECSAKTGQNVELVFEKLIQKILKNSGLI
ncbi:MAG: GTP-binding protein [Candidatus Lokiarchaeota archaeon]|nr:GTP-binding protein [Candidatus Lokiarchaeota archaeon]